MSGMVFMLLVTAESDLNERNINTDITTLTQNSPP